MTSRLGVMFFADLPKALGEMHRVLKPGGRVALLTWGAMEQPYFESTIGTVRRVRPGLEIPAAARAMFKFGVPGTLTALLAEAGFRKIDERVRGLRVHGTERRRRCGTTSAASPFRSAH